MLHAPLSIDAVSSPFTCFWETLGGANLAGVGDLARAPAALRAADPGFAFLSPDGARRSGDAASASMTGPIIGVREARVGAATPPDALVFQRSDRSAPLSAFAPERGRGCETAARGLRARLAAGERFLHQGAIWMHGEADAAIARAAGDIGHPAIADYAAGLSRIREFSRAQLGTPRVPWRFVAIAEVDEYAAAINDAMASLCRWRVGPGGLAEDMGAGRDAASYLVDHMILPRRGVHFDVTQMRAIGALVWEAHLHCAGPSGVALAHPITAIRPAWTRAPSIARRGAASAAVEAAASEDGALYAMAAPAAGRERDAAEIVSRGRMRAARRGEPVEITVDGLGSVAFYEMWSVFRAADGALSDVVSNAFMTRRADG